MIPTTKKEINEYIKKNYKNPFKVGDIIHHSWGYGQTNCDFYQVIRVTKASVVLRQINGKSVEGSEGFMCNRLIPDKDNFREKPFNAITKDKCGDGDKKVIKRVSAYMKRDGTLQYYIPTPYGWASKWDGEAKYNSWYH